MTSVYIKRWCAFSHYQSYFIAAQWLSSWPKLHCKTTTCRKSSHNFCVHNTPLQGFVTNQNHKSTGKTAGSVLFIPFMSIGPVVLLRSGSPLTCVVKQPMNCIIPQGAGTAQWQSASLMIEGLRFDCWQESYLLMGHLSVLILIWVSVLRPTPRITAAAHKISCSFCQKYRVQVTAEHTCTLCMWLWKLVHGGSLYGVHRTCTTAVSQGTSHVITKQCC